MTDNTYDALYRQLTSRKYLSLRQKDFADMNYKYSTHIMPALREYGVIDNNYKILQLLPDREFLLELVKTRAINKTRESQSKENHNNDVYTSQDLEKAIKVIKYFSDDYELYQKVTTKNRII
jgi:hypothetical protein